LGAAMSLQGFYSFGLQGLYSELQAFKPIVITPEDYYLSGVCVYDNKVYVSDYRNSRVVITDLNGSYIDQFQTLDGVGNVIERPKSIRSNGSNLFLMASNKLVKYDYDGTYVDSIDINTQTENIYATTDGIGVFYKEDNISWLVTYNNSLSEIRSCYYRNTFFKNSVIGYAGNIIFLNVFFNSPSSKTYIYNNSDTGDLENIQELNTTALFSSDALKNANDLYYSVFREESLAKVDISTGPPAIGTTYASRQFYYADYFNGEIYGIKSLSVRLNNSVFVIDVTDGSTVREWEY
jgi:hypothetical protein